MANYTISGVWKDEEGEITHYAFHDFNARENTMGQATKKSKAQAIRLLDNTGNSAMTVMWNYKDPGWDHGAAVTVVGTAPNKYLRSVHDGTVRDNLSHLINYGFIADDFK